MKNEIRIFDSKDTINLSKLIDTRMLICANSGGGKSYAVRKILEQSYGTQAIILDMEGEFHTLREKFDFLLIGGTNGDVPLNLRTAKLLPKTILELNVSTIIDLSDFKHKERILFVRDFLTALIELPRNLWRPLLVFIDEAHKFAGQQELQESVYAVIDLMAQGRKRGYSGILCTQRISKLHKDAAAEANNELIGRTVLDIDMKRSSDILGFNKKSDMLTLRELKEGEFFAYGPAFSFKGVEKVKVSSVETTHPKAGALNKIEISPPTPKIKAILTKLNTLPQEAEKELKDKNDMLKRIRELELQIKKMPQKVTGYGEADLASARQSGYKMGFAEVSKVATQEHNLRTKYESKLKEIQKYIKLLGDIAGIIEIPKDIPKIVLNKANLAIKKDNSGVKKEEIRIRPVVGLESELDSALGKGEKLILAFLVTRSGTSFTKQQIGAMTGYSWTSGTFNNYISNLKNGNYIILDSGKVSLVNPEEARQRIGSYDESMFSIKHWLNKLGKGPRSIYEILLDNPEQEFTKEELGEQTSYAPNSGTFNNYLSNLLTLGLIKKLNGKIKLNDEIQGI